MASKSLLAELRLTCSKFTPETDASDYATSRGLCERVNGQPCRALSYGVCDCTKAYGIFHDARAFRTLCENV